MIQTLRCFLREAIIGFWRQRGMNIVTVGIIAASLAILGGFLLLVENIGRIADDLNRMQINAYLDDEEAGQRPEEVAALVDRIASLPFVGRAAYVSREEALAMFRARFAGLAEAAGALRENPFPASIEISVLADRDANREGTRRLVADLEASPLVDMVQDNEDEARRLAAVIAVVSAIGVGVGGVLSIASVFIIFNVIRLTVNARRDEISIMRLVGATPGFIRGPFLVEGMLQGLLGAAVALAALYAAHLGLADYAARSGNGLAGLLTARFLPAASATALAAGGLIIGLAGSALSLRRFLAD